MRVLILTIVVVILLLGGGVYIYVVRQEGGPNMNSTWVSFRITYATAKDSADWSTTDAEQLEQLRSSYSEIKRDAMWSGGMMQNNRAEVKLSDNDSVTLIFLDRRHLLLEKQNRYWLITTSGNFYDTLSQMIRSDGNDFILFL